MDYLAGQGVGLVKEMNPAAEVVRELLEGARHILSTLKIELESWTQWRSIANVERLPPIALLKDC